MVGRAWNLDSTGKRVVLRDLRYKYGEHGGVSLGRCLYGVREADLNALG